jgi:hypothetical protein
MQKTNNLNLKLFTFLIFTILITACQPKPESDLAEGSEQDSLAEGIRLTVKQDVTEVDSFQVYTYQFLEDSKAPLADIPSVEKPAVSPADVVEKTIQPAKKEGAFRPPLFSRDCLTREDPERCSDVYLSAYIEGYMEKKKFETPVPTVKMYVSFVLDKKGQPIPETIKTAPQNAACKSCEAIAQEIVADMPGWVPGMADGEMKKSVIRFPIYFKN